MLNLTPSNNGHVIQWLFNKTGNDYNNPSLSNVKMLCYIKEDLQTINFISKSIDYIFSPSGEIAVSNSSAYNNIFDLNNNSFTIGEKILDFETTLNPLYFINETSFVCFDNNNNNIKVVVLNLENNSYSIYNYVLSYPLTQSSTVSNNRLNIISHLYEQLNITSIAMLSNIQKDNYTLYNTYDANISSDDIINNKIGYGLNGKITGTMPNNGALNYTPSTQSQTIPAGYTSGGTIAGVTSSIDSNIQAGNIKSGVSILGISGTYAGSGITPDTTIANGDYGLENATSGEGNNDIGYKFFANANTQSKLYEVGSIVEVHITNELLAQILGITADKIKSGEIICGIEGTYTGEVVEEV